jgi:hypothetical protein
MCGKLNMAGIKRNWDSPPWYTSYNQHRYGDLFYSLVRVYQPKKIIELGTKAGFSAYHMARGLKANGKGKLYCYDLWERYQYHSVPKSVAEKNLKKYKDFISLKLQDAVNVHKLHKSADILHIDISNDGIILEKIIPNWIDKIRQFLIIEGGSAERDKVEWMTKYNKIPIKKWLQDFSNSRGDIEYVTIEPFPSVTIIRKKNT